MPVSLPQSPFRPANTRDRASCNRCRLHRRRDHSWGVAQRGPGHRHGTLGVGNRRGWRPVRALHKAARHLGLTILDSDPTGL
jgi:hypothetical protein